MTFWSGRSDLFYELWGWLLVGAAAISIWDVIRTKGRPRLQLRIHRQIPSKLYSTLLVLGNLAILLTGIGFLSRALRLATVSSIVAGGFMAIGALATLWYGSRPPPHQRREKQEW